MYLQSHIYKNIPVSFDFITTLNQGVFFVFTLYIGGFWQIAVSRTKYELKADEKNDVAWLYDVHARTHARPHTQR